MTEYLPIIFASGLLAFIATPLTRLLAQRVGMIDQPGLRKAHRSPVPLLGGLAIYLALFSAILFAFNRFGGADWLAEGLGILGGATILFFTGLWDDRFGMRARFKLLAQVVAAVCLLAGGVQVHLFNTPWLDLPISLAWIVGITNAANLMDNMDGLTAGISAVAAFFFFVLAVLEGQVLVAGLAAALGGAAAGFLFYNFSPAISFMGDAGSLTLGFMLAVLGIKIRFIHHELGTTWMVPIVVLGALIFDTTLVIISRLRRGRSIFQGGSDHTSHRLAQLGLGSARAVLTLYVVTVALGVLAIFLTRSSILVANSVFGVLVLTGLLVLIAFERIEPKLAGDPALVLIPGGGGGADLVRAVRPLTRELTILLAPRQLGDQVVPRRAEVIEMLALLAEDETAVRELLTRGLSEVWWQDFNQLNRALRLSGFAITLTESPLPENLDLTGLILSESVTEALATIRKAKIILCGPGELSTNVEPVLSIAEVADALQQTRGFRINVQSQTSSGAVKANPNGTGIELSALATVIQSHLLDHAAGHAKTQT